MKILSALIQNIDHFFAMVDSITSYASGDLRLFSKLELALGYTVNFGVRFLFDLLN